MTDEPNLLFKYKDESLKLKVYINTFKIVELTKVYTEVGGPPP